MRALIKLILNDNLSRIKLMKDSTIRALYRHIYSKIWLKTSTRADHLFFLDYAPSIELKKLVLVKDLDLDILFKLLNKKINYKGNPALAHGRLPLELIESHFKSAEEFDHQCLARNPALPEDKMEFYFNKYPVSLALNRALTKEQCERLLATEDVSVLTNLLRNPAMPVDVIQKQLKTISTKYAQDLVYNWGLTSEMLDYFMFGNNNILSGCAIHPNLSYRNMKRLVKHDYSLVREFLCFNKSLPEDLALELEKEEAMIPSLCKNHRLSLIVLEKIFKEHPLYHKDLVWNQSLSQDLIKELLKSKDQEIRTAAINHPNCPERNKKISDLLHLD